jgi:hypothetical protein
MSITDDVSELYNLEVEIKRLAVSLKELRKQKTKCEERVLEYLDVNSLPGIKYKDSVVMVHKRKRQPKLPKKEQEEMIGDLLAKYEMSREQYDGIVKDLRRSPEYIQTLKIK